MSNSPVLGDLLKFAQSPSKELETWLSSVDRSLAARVFTDAEIRGESLAQFIRIAVADFLAEADEPLWADLLSAARNAHDPGAACLDKMTAFRVRIEIGS